METAGRVKHGEEDSVPKAISPGHPQGYWLSGSDPLGKNSEERLLWKKLLDGSREFYKY